MPDQTLSIKIQRVYKLPNDGPIRAFVDMTINDALLIKGLRVVSGKNGLFVAMPREQGKDKKWYETVRCLSKSLEAQVIQAVLEAFEKEES
jgi:stage V sporulation protein G